MGEAISLLPAFIYFIHTIYELMFLILKFGNSTLYLETKSRFAMKKFSQDLNGDDLALILLQTLRERKQKNTFLLKLKHLLRQIIVSLNKEPKAKVGQVKDYYGNTIWCVYDPITGQSARLNFEVEVRLWLKERYYPVDEQGS